MNRQETRRAMADFYKRKWQSHDGFWIDIYKPHQRVYASSLNECRNRHILRALPEEVSRALDLGCGVGDLTFLLSQRVDSVVGIDLGEINVAMARRNLRRAEASNSGILQGTATELPFEDGSFDALVLADVIEHIVDTRSALAEMKRVLRAGGTGIFVTPLASWMSILAGIDGFAQRILRRDRRGRATSAPVYESFLSRKEMRRAVRDAGFKILRYRPICFYPGPEGSGVFTMLMAGVHRYAGKRTAGFVTRFFIRTFDLLERLRIFNQKQMWVLRA